MMMKIGGKTIEWDSEVLTDEPGKRIAWRSIGGDSDDGVSKVPTNFGRDRARTSGGVALTALVSLLLLLVIAFPLGILRWTFLVGGVLRMFRWLILSGLFCVCHWILLVSHMRMQSQRRDSPWLHACTARSTISATLVEIAKDHAIRHQPACTAASRGRRVAALADYITLNIES
jgi:hypothetical protein